MTPASSPSSTPATGLLNGTRARLQAVDARRHVLILRTDHDQGTIGVPFRYADDGHLTHGYAMTIHKAQGTTVDTCRILVGDAMNREQLYTALSRGRTENHLYIEEPDRRLLDRHVRELAPTAEQLLQATLARSGAQHLAAEHDGDEHIPLSVLRAERDRLRQVVAGQPHDPRPDLTALAEERREARRLLAEAIAARDNAQHQLGDMGPMDRLLHRDRRTSFEQRLKRLSRHIGDHTEHLAQIEGRRDQLQPALAECRAWRSDHKADLDR